MLANSTIKGTFLLSRLVGRAMGITTRSMSAYDAPKVGQLEEVKEEQRFVMPIGDGDIAFIEYELSHKTYDLIETIVPEEYSGHGLGRILARETFDCIIRQKGKIKLSCSFLQRFYEQNQDKYRGHIV